jgi:hypothetical protein
VEKKRVMGDPKEGRTKKRREMEMAQPAAPRANPPEVLAAGR